MAFIIIYITHENMDQARKITSHLLKERLIACANLFPISSAYWWQGEITDSSEVVSIVKTRTENWEKVCDEVQRIHPYRVPCIMRLDVQANRRYEDWIQAETDRTFSR